MKVDPIRTRWSDTPPSEAGLPETALAGELFRSVTAPRARKPQAILSLLVDIRRREITRHAGWFEHTTVLRRAAVVFSVFVSINFAMAFTVTPVKRWWSTTLHLAPIPSQPAPSVTASPRAGQPVASVIVTEPSAAPEPPARLAMEPLPQLASPVASAASGRRRVVAEAAPRMVPVPAPVPAAPVPTLAAESQLLDSALAALGHGQPAAALTALATYRDQFPNGSLAYEANLAEVKAQMAAGQNGRALSVLERIINTAGFDSLPRSDELTLLHAELLARTKDYTRAVAAFDQVVLSPNLEGPLAERALYGRAACFASQGDWPGNQSALHDYLRRFPNGRFASEAQQGLARGE